MKILSVDWDFFFPNIDGYDWGHHEESAFLYEAVWSIRAGNHDMFGKHALATDAVRPDPKKLRGFWQKACGGTTAFLAICESHKAMYEWVTANQRAMSNLSITNYDSHHDFGYRKDNSKLDCGNWAKHLLQERRLKEYHVVYPEWRKDHPESFPTTERPTSIRYGMPDKTECYTGVFICRSSCWTPTWADKEWTKFIEYWKRSDRDVWDRKTYSPYVLGERKPDLEAAQKMAEDQVAALKAWRESQKSA